MVGQNSNLSAYGYDLVVATTQRSINGTIKDYFEETSFTPQAVTILYGSYQGVPYAYSLSDFIDFMSSKLNYWVIPFQVSEWDGTGDRPQGVANLQQIGFLEGFSATIGSPAGYLVP